METIVWLLKGLLGFLKFLLIDYWLVGTSIFLRDWPYLSDKSIDVVIIPVMLVAIGGMIMGICFFYPIFLRTDEKIEKKPPTGRGDIILNPNSLIIRMLHRYFGKYPESSCHIIRYVIGFALGIMYAFYGFVWFLIGLSAIPYHLPKIISAIITESGGALSNAVSVVAVGAQSIINLAVVVISFLIAPAILSTILFLILLMLFLRSGLKTQVVFLGASIKNKICFKIEYRQ